MLNWDWTTCTIEKRREWRMKMYLHREWSVALEWAGGQKASSRAAMQTLTMQTEESKQHAMTWDLLFSLRFVLIIPDIFGTSECGHVQFMKYIPFLRNCAIERMFRFSVIYSGVIIMKISCCRAAIGSIFKCKICFGWPIRGCICPRPHSNI